ncbi:MAG: glycine-rich protein, partial [Bacteroidia bacterium]
MKKQLLTIGLLSALSLGLSAQTQTYNFTGGMQSFTVPCGVTSVFIQTWGAQGGAGAVGGNNVAGGAGGLGGYAEGFLAVNPGDVLNIFVGGQGATPAAGFNGGGTGGSQNAGGGGGASDVRTFGTAEANRVITAGGGGGGGRGGCHEGAASGGTGGTGGFGGGGVGVTGNDSPQS